MYVEYPGGSWRIAGIIQTILGCEPQITAARLEPMLWKIQAVVEDILEQTGGDPDEPGADVADLSSTEIRGRTKT